MNKQWVDERLRMLSGRLGIFRPNPHEFYFEPTDTIYDRLGSGDERDLQFVVTAIARHIGMSSVPTAVYDWGLKMDLEVAGQIRPDTWHIQIPFFSVGKPHAVGTIIAHEITHAFLFLKGIGVADTQENELLTDVSVIFIGLGKLWLNGLVVVANVSFRQA